MKKTYSSPAFRINSCDVEQFLAVSMKYTKTTVSDKNNIGFTKEEKSSTYNVWSDNWEK